MRREDVCQDLLKQSQIRRPVDKAQVPGAEGNPAAGLDAIGMAAVAVDVELHGNLRVEQRVVEIDGFLGMKRIIDSRRGEK
jgi:hypothetical protein